MSISRKINTLAAVTAVFFAVMVTAVIFYVFSQYSEKSQIQFLEDQALIASARLGEQFQRAQNTERAANRALAARLDRLGTHLDVNERFNQLFPLRPDGTRRIDSDHFEGVFSAEGAYSYGMAAYFPPRAQYSIREKAVLIFAYDIVRSFGQGIHADLKNFYFYTPSSELVIFAPDRADKLMFYRENAPATFSFRGSDIDLNMRPARNPTRSTMCTDIQPVVYDETGKTRTTGCQTPFDYQGEHLGAFGVSFLVDGWLRDAIRQGGGSAPAMLMLADGKIIAHQQLLDDPEAKAEDLTNELRSVELAAMISKRSGQNGVLKFPPWGAFVAYSRLEGTGWIHLIPYDANLIRKSATNESAKIAAAIFIGLLISLYLLFLYCRDQVAIPIRELIAQTNNGISQKSDHEKRLHKKNDEIGALSQALLERNYRYNELLQSLEKKVAERTKELELSRAEAISANNAKSAFLANMSHEIRTPMNGVLGIAQALQREPLTETQSDMVDIINHSGELLVNILNDILDMSKIEAGEIEIKSSRSSVQDALEASFRVFEPIADDKGIDLIIEYDKAMPPELSFDVGCVNQCLANLLSNAIKFTERGSVSVCVSVAACGSPKEKKIEVSVKDTGIGISGPDQEKLFAPFIQVESGPAKNFGGTGLGLSIARRLARAMGGDITVESELGSGSSFLFSFIAEDLSANAPRERASAG